MGSTESTLPEMEEEEESVIERIARRRRRTTTIATEGVANEIQQQQARSVHANNEQDTANAVTAAPESTTTTTTTTAETTAGATGWRRRRRFTDTDVDSQQRERSHRPPNWTDDPWWWEIENEDLILDQAPNVTGLLNDSVTAAAEEVAKSPNQLGDAEQGPTPTAEVTTASGEGEASTAPEVVEKNATAEAPEVEREQTLDEFKEELRRKRLARQSAVQDLRDELSSLRQQLAAEKELTRKLRKTEESAVAETVETESEKEPAKEDADDQDPMSRGRHANIELANAQLALQLANSENISLRAELGAVRKQVTTLKDVVSCCKQMLQVKEEQCDQLKEKLNEIERTVAEKEMNIMSESLRKEYEKQLENIRQLRALYEERQRVASAEYENLQRLISIKKDELLAAQDKIKSVEERNEELLKEVENLNKELAQMKEECNEHKFEKKALKEEMGAINTLFSQMIIGFNGKNNLDIDRLTTMLEENRSLLNDMATKEVSCSDNATLPKLLFELVEQASVTQKNSRSSTPLLTPSSSDAEEEDVPKMAAVEQADEVDATAAPAATTNRPKSTTKKSSRRTQKASKGGTSDSLKLFDSDLADKVASTQEIIGYLPKVWRVLMELLSHHHIEQVQLEEGEATCNKSVDNPNGSKPELSVSKTYIRLKDLILEKKSLVKETSRLKMLNSHLDYRLNEQQKRLSAVSLELTKTWHLVGKMQRQHRQLHTQEQILRYQLQQKRRLLTELKDELEYCRRKWAAARAKNDESQEQWNELRREFAQRKLDDTHNSAESGYSDSGPPSDEESAVAPPAGTNCRRKLLKEMFEHTRKVKRMQSTSPGRALRAQDSETGNATREIVLRWNSAPPTCGWRATEDEEDEVAVETVRLVTSSSVDQSTMSGVPGRCSRSRERHERQSGSESASPEGASESTQTDDAAGGGEQASRILRLEEQCKSLIHQVMETSDNRERLEVQLCRLQDEIAPVQYAMPLQDVMNRRRLERMTRASSVPAAGSLTPREEEYTRKRSERLERLEEESRQLIWRIKRTSDRGHYLRCSLDRIRRNPSHEGSFESNTEEREEVEVPEEGACGGADEDKKEPLTEEEEAYTARRSLRLSRLEEEGRKLVSTLAQNQQRGEGLGRQLDVLHERYGSEGAGEGDTTMDNSIEQRIENIQRISSTRAERLRILEEEGKELLTRLTNTSERGTQMINRIAEREQQRSARLAATNSAKNNGSNNNEDERDENKEAGTKVLLPTVQTVACSSIVGEEVSNLVTVTTTSSQLATNQSVASKPTRPLLQLNAARPTRRIEPARQGSEEETIEEMVRRLQELPFPDQAADEGNADLQDENHAEEKE